LLPPLLQAAEHGRLRDQIRDGHFVVARVLGEPLRQPPGLFQRGNQFLADDRQGHRELCTRETRS
jgi:hypothetical protein